MYVAVLPPWSTCLNGELSVLVMSSDLLLLLSPCRHGVLVFQYVLTAGDPNRSNNIIIMIGVRSGALFDQTDMDTSAEGFHGSLSASCWAIDGIIIII